MDSPHEHEPPEEDQAEGNPPEVQILRKVVGEKAQWDVDHDFQEPYRTQDFLKRLRKLGRKYDELAHMPLSVITRASLQRHQLVSDFMTNVLLRCGREASVLYFVTVPNLTTVRNMVVRKNAIINRLERWSSNISYSKDYHALVSSIFDPAHGNSIRWLCSFEQQVEGFKGELCQEPVQPPRKRLCTGRASGSLLLQEQVARPTLSGRSDLGQEGSQTLSAGHAVHQGDTFCQGNGTRSSELILNMDIHSSTEGAVSFEQHSNFDQNPADQGLSLMPSGHASNQNSSTHDRLLPSSDRQTLVRQGM
ncbi:hypothetical protein FH972_024096 [Carpinus fangiana]|uniref:Uncharacterized protein n=1 Tax=Carpinus fangiana TaxID=176857 RepID=A0A5N6KX12_9ROSI|nr:hypothetical protein FH972_024096 [Carpinus fangiana]